MSHEEHAGLKAEYELISEKLANLKLREGELVTQLAAKQSAERELAEETRRVKEMQDEVTAVEIEMEVLHLRLNGIDPLYKKFTMAF